MFLSLLSEKSKKCFYELCVYTAKVDNMLCDEEKVLLGEYCKEMQIEFNLMQSSNSLDDILANISECSDEEKRIILFELIALIYADKKMHKNENEVLKKFILTNSIDEDTVMEMISLYENYVAVYKEICKVIF